MLAADTMKLLEILTFCVVVGCRDEDEVARLHVLLAIHGDGERVEHVALVPRAEPEAEVLLEVAHHAAHEAATVEEEGAGVFRLCNGKHTFKRS